METSTHLDSILTAPNSPSVTAKQIIFIYIGSPTVRLSTPTRAMVITCSRSRSRIMEFSVMDAPTIPSLPPRSMAIHNHHPPNNSRLLNNLLPNKTHLHQRTQPP